MAKIKSIWESKCISPLEFCTIARASNLLGCQIEDILHWMEIGAIFSYGKFTGVESELRFRVYKLELYNRDYKDEIFYDNRFVYGQSLFIAEQQPVPDEEKHVRVSGKVYGYWRIQQWSFGSNEYNSLIYPVERDSNHRHFHVALPERLFLDVSDIYVSKGDIEKIYEHSLKGAPIPISNVPAQQQHEESNEVMSGSRYMDILDLLIATHPDFGEVYLNASNNALADKIGNYASKLLRELKVTSPDLEIVLKRCEKTDRKTLAKFRDR